MSSLFRMKSSSTVVPTLPTGLITFTLDIKLTTVDGEETDDGEEEGVDVISVAAIKGFPLLLKVLLLVLLIEGSFVVDADAADACWFDLLCDLDCRGLGPGFDRPVFVGW